MPYKGLKDDFYERMKPRLHRRIGRELRLARRIFDFGCGSCDLVRYLAETYHQNVTGVDIASDSFPKRRRRGDGARFRCLRRSAVRLPFAADGAADAVVMMWSLHEMKSPRAVLVETRRLLRPGGELLVVDFPRKSLARRLWDEKFFRPAEVERLLEKAGFLDIRLRLIERGQIIWARGYQPMVQR
jgi:ArsR family transcriptional regulator